MSEKLTEREKWIIEQCSISWAPKGCSIDEAYFIDNAPACTRIAELEAEVGRLKKEFGRLLVIVNPVTCAHRHGSPIRDKHLTALSNFQIDCEAFLAALSPQVGEKCGKCDGAGMRYVMGPDGAEGDKCPDCQGTGEA